MRPSHQISVPGVSLPAGSVVAGYRVIRQLSGDTGQESWLALAAGREAQPCVLTFCTDDEAGRRRLLVHETVRSPHVLSLLDIATDAGGRILLATERTDWTLATLIASRADVVAGEAVTVLAPLAAGLAAVHAAGFVHRRLGPAAVLFTANGRPVLGGLDDLATDAIQARRSDGTAGLSAGASADYRALAGVIRSVAERIEEQARPGFVAIADWLDGLLDENAELDALPARLECRIFAEAEPLPLVLVADRQPPSAPRVAAAGRRQVRTLPRVGQRGMRVAGLAAVRSAAEILSRCGPGVWLRRLLRGRGLAVCVGIAVLVTVVSAGLAVVPDIPSAGRPTAERATRATATEPRQTPQAAVETDFAGGEAAAVTGDDPVAAAFALLALRARCAAVDAVQCVSRFAEPESALDAADRQAFTGDANEALLVPEESRARIEIVQEYGDAVLTRAVPVDEKRQPVLVLVVRTDTGWRLRDVFEPD